MITSITLLIIPPHPFSCLIIERSRHVDGASHVLDSEGTTDVTVGDFITNASGWGKAGTYQCVYE